MKKIIYQMFVGCFIVAALVLVSACNENLDIQTRYPFTVEVMPVPNKVVKGETVEIRCELKKEGNYANTLYTIRFFQFEGAGTLKTENGIVFQPNDRYLLENEKFRLYYTSGSTESQNFIVVVEDNNNQFFEMEFSFNNENKEEEKGGEV